MNPKSTPFGYLPVLRWKAAEISALSKLEPRVRGLVFPVIELCPTAFVTQKRTPEKKYKKEILPISILLDRMLKLKSAIGERPVGIDLLNIKDGESPYTNREIWNVVQSGQSQFGLRVVPITGFNRKGIAYQKLIGNMSQAYGNGVCVRLTVPDLHRRSFPRELDELLAFIQHDPESIDLILDLKLIYPGSPTYSELGALLPYLTHWRSLTVLGGSFPVNLSKLAANDTHDLPREEWLKWRNESQGFGNRFSVGPIFGDYTIQHPTYQEPVPAPHVSASIRYTSSDRWVVFRGEWIGKKNGSGCDQYPAWAQILVARPDLYKGAAFSFGDQYIMEKSLDGRKPGGPREWLRAGMNHHITFAVCQLHPELLEQAEKEAAPVVQSTTMPAPSLSRV